MVVSVRAAGVACLGLIALTAAASPPIASDPTLSPDSAQIATAPANQPPAYFVLTDRAEAAPQAVAASDAPVETAVDALPTADTDAMGADARCLAVAVYYESRGEPLAGQLAVANVILNRARSGRFADTPCGVVRQPGQFSFARRSFAPPANADWKKAVSVAQAAMAGSGGDRARGALYFHASYVSPGWARAEVATIGHHIFYR